MTKNKEQPYQAKETEIKELLKQKEIFVKELRIRQNKSKKYFIDILFSINFDSRFCHFGFS